MEWRFDFDKSVQAAASLLHLEDGKMSYFRLLKLLYIAERELLAQKATSLTGDIYKAMDHGPVLSHILDIIKGKGTRSAEWEGFIKRSGYSIQLVRDPGRGRLSGDAIDKLVEVSDRYRDKNDWDLRDLTREFPEWKKNYPGGGSALIPLKDILEAQGEGDDTLAVIQEAEAVRHHMSQIFGKRKSKKPQEFAEPAP